MSSLKFYLKDHLLVNATVLPISLFGIIYAIINAVIIIGGEADYSSVRLFIQTPLIMVISVFFGYIRIKEILLVHKDIKEQELLTDIFYVNSHGFSLCENGYMGAYQEIYCTKKQNDSKKKRLWWYKNQLIYPTFNPPGEKYEITYYKNSCCIYSIKQITFVNKSKSTLPQKTNNKKVLVDNHNIYFHNNLDGFIVWLWATLLLPVIFFLGNKYIPTIHLLKNNYDDALFFSILFSCLYLSFAFIKQQDTLFLIFAIKKGIW